MHSRPKGGCVRFKCVRSLRKQDARHQVRAPWPIPILEGLDLDMAKTRLQEHVEAEIKFRTEYDVGPQHAKPACSL